MLEVVDGSSECLNCIFVMIGDVGKVEGFCCVVMVDRVVE